MWLRIVAGEHAATIGREKHSIRVGGVDEDVVDDHVGVGQDLEVRRCRVL